MTFGDGTAGVSGPITVANSVVGATASTNLQAVVVDNVNGTFLASFPREGGGRVRVGSQQTGFAAAGGTLLATLDAAGNLVVSDADPAGRDNRLTVRRAGADLLISDAAELFQPAPAGASLSDGGRTLTIPLSLVTGSLTVHGHGGGDALTVDLAGGNPLPPGGLTFHGGPGSPDALLLQGGAVATLTFDFASATDGGVSLGGLGTVSYTGVDSVSSALDAAAVVLNYGAAAEAITVQPFADDPTHTQLTSGAAAAVDFANPTASLALNAGDTGDDRIDVNGFGTGFRAALALDGQGGNDTVHLNTALALGSATSPSAPRTSASPSPSTPPPAPSACSPRTC